MCLRGAEFNHLKRNKWSQDHGYVDINGLMD